MAAKERFKTAEDGSLVVALSTGATYKVREPRGKDTRELSKLSKVHPDMSHTDAGFHMIVMLSTPVGDAAPLTMDALDEMLMRDVELLGEAIANFRPGNDRR